MNTYELTPTRRAALERMPVRLQDDGCLPLDGPRGDTIRWLYRHGLIRQQRGRWEMTMQGARALEEAERAR